MILKTSTKTIDSENLEKQLAESLHKTGFSTSSNSVGQSINLRELRDKSTLDLNKIPVRSHHKILGPFIKLFKRLVRKSTWYLLDDLVAQQNEYNVQVLKTISQLADENEQLKAKLKKLSEK